ncbi:MAG: DICT sensory domain-containing protein [Ilumatobacteraceae bacterium]
MGRKGLLIDLSLHLERHGLGSGIAPIVLSAFQTTQRFTPGTRARYSELAAASPLVAALGVGLVSDDFQGVHMVGLDPADALAGEWTVTVVGPHHAAALIARDLGDDGPDLERRFEFVVTHDRPTVLTAARSLMSRITTQADQPAHI